MPVIVKNFKEGAYMFFKKKKKRGLYSEVTDVSKICATCKYASALCTVDDFMCSKHGLVSRDYCCKSYDYNRLIKRPPKKRQIKNSRFSAEDFSID